MEKDTYLERLLKETLGPVIGAIEMFKNEISQTMQIPDAPWKILNKPYDQLSEQEIAALLDIYHQEGEQEPCPMCDWMARTELMKSRQNQKEGI
jgi:hypothetical protein